MIELVRAYANGSAGLDYPSRVLGNLVLALGFSTGLHAALLSSLERLPLPQGSGPLRLTLSLETGAQTDSPPEMSAAGAPVATAATKSPKPMPAVRASSVPERYLTSREVDTPAWPRVKVPLLYPEAALVWKLRGMVRLRVFISEHGTVDSVQIVRADPPGEFEEAALAAVQRLVYEPALKGGRAVKSQKLIEVTFDPYETPRP